MRDGSDAIADWPILNALLNAVAGASWVSFHHGGGVGIGYSLHAGMVVVADGTPEAARAARARAHDRSRHGRRCATPTPAIRDAIAGRPRRAASRCRCSRRAGEEAQPPTAAVAPIQGCGGFAPGPHDQAGPGEIHHEGPRPRNGISPQVEKEAVRPSAHEAQNESGQSRTNEEAGANVLTPLDRGPQRRDAQTGQRPLLAIG